MSPDDARDADRVDDHDATGLELAREIARSLRSAPGRRVRRAGRGPADAQLSGARADGRDPMLVGAAVEKLVDSSGWEGPLASHSVFARWSDIVGAEVASHCAPERLAEGRLVVRADSTAWATELRLQAAVVLRRVNDELGPDSVTFIDFVGPDAPSWGKGRRSVRGGRGPRDTYG